jgi:hypothetical protein
VSLASSDLSLGMAHTVRDGWRASRSFAVAAVATTLVAHLLAMLTAAHQADVAAAGITTTTLAPLAAGLWAALALLPALGGGDSDDPLAVAAVGGGRTFTFGSRIAASLTDAGPGLFVPALALIGAAAAGWPGWLAGLALAFNGLACGQLVGAASGQLMRRIGPTWTLLVVAGLVLLTATWLVSRGWGPGAWWQASTSQSGYLVALVATGGGALVLAWWLNRPLDRTLRPSRSVPLPRGPFGALVVVMVTGIGRSVVARSTVITAALAPLLVRSAGEAATAAIALFVMAAASPVLGANGYAYDGGAAVWLLGKTSRRSLVLARLVTTSCWLMVLATVASVVGALVGAPVAVDVLPLLPLVAVGSAAAGLVPSVRRPMPVDADSFRAQAAPVVSATGALSRSCVLTVIAVTVPLWLASLLVGAYVVVAVLHALRQMRDPVALTSLT